MTAEQLVVFPLLVLFIVLLAIFVRRWPTIWRKIRYQGSENWTSVPATIKVSEVRESRSSEGSLYRPCITYTYSVDGQEHIGHFRGNFYPSPEEAQLDLSEICQQAALMVRVHPSKSKTSVLVLP